MAWSFRKGSAWREEANRASIGRPHSGSHGGEQRTALRLPLGPSR
jgi:hypothetical protein